MKPILRLIFLICLLYTGMASAQTTQLYYQGFQSGTSGLALGVDSPLIATGPNRWTINAEYNGKGVYPNTPGQANAVGGTIAFPDSNYLHIYDTTLASIDTVFNCNYNNGVASDNFVYISNGICTRGFTDVHFSFFYIAEGSASAYGSVYYSIDGGDWIQCGSIYSGQTVWKMEDISLSEFENHFDVRFGFRWANDTATAANTISFGIDDIKATGEYTTLTPLHISVTSVTPDDVCGKTLFKFSYHQNQPYCDGTYQLVISDGGGDFTSGDTTVLGTFNIAQGDTASSVSAFAPVLSGICYKFRVDRVTPPYTKGIPSTSCVSINDCPYTISALRPSVTLGPDTLCARSAMDVSFYSTGTYNANNTYVVQLSDVNGSFNNPKIIATVADENTYDPYEVFVAPSISGKVPETTPGCGYYVRIISTSPSYIPGGNQTYGPFCIRNCDITTNNNQDVHMCITDSMAANKTITITTDSWNSHSVHYQAGNQFVAQLLSPYSYFVINTIPLGVVTADTSATLVLRVPSYDSLYSVYGLFTGTYFLRVMSTNSDSQSDTLGTLIRLTIGESKSEKPRLRAYDDNFTPKSVFCAGEPVTMLPDNWYLLSSYEWETAFDITQPQPFLFDPPLTIQSTPTSTPGKYWFTAREVNYGCFSPWSDTSFVTILAKPNVAIATGSNCKGDTVDVSVAYQDNTLYSWGVSGNTSNRHIIVSDEKNKIQVVFDSLKSYTISVHASNMCGISDGNKTLTVKEQPEQPVLSSTVNNVLDSVVFLNQVLYVNVVNNHSSSNYQWSSSFYGGLTYSFSPLAIGVFANTPSGKYWFIAREIDNGCFSDWSDTIWVSIISSTGINESNSSEPVFIGPNPAAGEVFIYAPAATGVYSIVLTDMTGHVIKQQTASGSLNSINMKELPGGMYFVKIKGKGERLFKLIKE